MARKAKAATEAVGPSSEDSPTEDVDTIIAFDGSAASRLKTAAECRRAIEDAYDLAAVLMVAAQDIDGKLVFSFSSQGGDNIETKGPLPKDSLEIGVLRTVAKDFDFIEHQARTLQEAFDRLSPLIDFSFAKLGSFEIAGQKYRLFYIYLLRRLSHSRAFFRNLQAAYGEQPTTLTHHQKRRVGDAIDKKVLELDSLRENQERILVERSQLCRDISDYLAFENGKLPPSQRKPSGGGRKPAKLTAEEREVRDKWAGGAFKTTFELDAFLHKDEGYSALILDRLRGRKARDRKRKERTQADEIISSGESPEKKTLRTSPETAGQSQSRKKNPNARRTKSQ